MSAPLPHHRFPVAYLVDEPIEYVTDNDRDAEAVSCRTESPVVVDLQARAAAESTADVSKAFRTSKRSRRSSVRNASQAANVEDVSDVTASETFEVIPDVPNVQDTSDVETFDL